MNDLAARVPRYTGDVAELSRCVALLAAEASRMRRAAADMDVDFAAVGAFYQAPEAERLFTASRVLTAVGEELLDATREVQHALQRFGERATVLSAELDRQRALLAGELCSPGDPVIPADADRIPEETQSAIDRVLSEFQEAEREAANRINAACGFAGRFEPVSQEGAVRFGYGLEIGLLEQAERPWGEPPEQQGFWHGFVVDGAWGTVVGMKELLTSGEPWVFLGQSLVGIASYSNFTAWIDDEDLPGWLQDSRAAARELGKSFVAWDHWEHDKGRVSGVILFNLVTLAAGPLGHLARSGRAGGASAVLRGVSHFGTVIDPTTYVGNLTRNSVSGASHLARAERLYAIEPRATLALDGTVTYPNGTSIARDGTISFPDGARVTPDNVLHFGPDSEIARITSDGRMEFRDGTVLDPDPPLGPRGRELLTAAPESARASYPHLEDTVYLHAAEAASNTMSYLPWSQTAEAEEKHADRGADHR